MNCVNCFIFVGHYYCIVWFGGGGYIPIGHFQEIRKYVRKHFMTCVSRGLYPDNKSGPNGL